MRPPEFTGGNCSTTGIFFLKGTTACWCFNEAAGIHRRKPRAHEVRCWRELRSVLSFNEAAGIHRRKPQDTGRVVPG